MVGACVGTVPDENVIFCSALVIAGTDASREDNLVFDVVRLLFVFWGACVRVAGCENAEGGGGSTSIGCDTSTVLWDGSFLFLASASAYEISIRV